MLNANSCPQGGSLFNPKSLRLNDITHDLQEDASENDGTEYRAFLLSLIVMHKRYVDSLSSPDESVSTTKFVQCKDLAVYLSGLLCEDKSDVTDVLKMVKAGIDYSFKEAPKCLSFLTCGVLHFAFKLPRSYYLDIIKYAEKRKGMMHLVEVQSGSVQDSSWCHYSTFVETLREEAQAQAGNTDLLDMKSLCLRSQVEETDYSAYLSKVADSRSKRIAQREIGKEGERLAVRFFSSRVKDDMTVRWVNEETEQGDPFDLCFEDKGKRPIYMDVKATTVENKKWFLISENEYRSAVQNGPFYVFAHLGVSQGDSIMLNTYRDPKKLIKERVLKLALHPISDVVDKVNWSSFKRRDQLLETEDEVRKWWDECRVFDVEANDGEKLFFTFPVPYMNGHLHLGHAYTISKVDFAAFFHRLRGTNVLLPFGFHCTGMPIKALSDKLKKEMEEFGNPPCFPLVESDSTPELELTEDVTTSGKRCKGKKPKSLSKRGQETTYQWKIMRDSGMSDSEISTFQDPATWLRFFPPLAIEDLKAFGLGADWRRSFIITDKNLFYDSFVRWHLKKLKLSGMIVKEQGYMIYSPLDGQPCADHDRASGEGVTTDEFLIVKMEVVPPFPAWFEPLYDKKVYLAGAIRPETMNSLRNVFVLPDGNYGAYEINESDVFVLTERAARNLAYQGFSRVPETPTCLMELTGGDLIGLRLRSPATSNEIVCASLDSVLINKGTGIQLTCDPPDKTKALSSSEMLENGEAVAYFEPARKVISRSGDECVVAFTDQWCIKYGEPNWKTVAKHCLNKMKIYSDNTTCGECKDGSRSALEMAINRIGNWSCSRRCGPGTRIPWDEQFLVESLSDSTIYMAYYTVSHILQNGDMYGEDTKSIKPEQLTDDVWDYIFLEGPEPKSTNVSLTLLENMRKEFDYWYPVDVRVSGNDLIQNHLAFCIFNHTAIFPERHWPREFKCNRHISFNNKKMSKLTGNYKTLKEAIDEFSADAVRLSLADAGDANFLSTTAQKAVLWLTKEKKWMEEFLADNPSKYRVGPPHTFADRVFANMIHYAIITTEKSYHQYNFQEALNTGFHVLQAAKNDYAVLCGAGAMNRDLLCRFMDVQTRLLVPICPHYAEYVWRNLLKQDGFVIKSGWPEAENHDLFLEEAHEHLKKSISHFRKLIEKQVSSSKKDKVGKESTKSKPTIGLIFVKQEYDGWEKQFVEVLFDKFKCDNRTFAPDEEMIEAFKQRFAIEGGLHDVKPRDYMPFMKTKKHQASRLGAKALGLRLPFDEISVFKENTKFIKRELGLDDVIVLSVTDPKDKASPYASMIDYQTAASPGSPTFMYF